MILVAYTNEQAFRKSIETRTLVLWSTSRNELWEKGKTSGESFDLVDARVNCEQNSLLYVVRPKGQGICHTKNAKGEVQTSTITFDKVEVNEPIPAKLFAVPGYGVR